MSETKKFRVGETGRVVELENYSDNAGPSELYRLPGSYAGQWIPRPDMEMYLGAPLVELPPEPTMWKARHDGYLWRRGPAGQAQCRWPAQNEWDNWDDDSRDTRIAAAIREGREPSPDIAERVPPASGPATTGEGAE